MLEESQTSARKLWAQPCGLSVVFSLVCCSILRNHQRQVLGGSQEQGQKLRREWEGDLIQYQRDLGPISASQGCHSMTLSWGMRLSQALLKGQPATFCKRGKARAGDTGGSVVLSLGWGGEVRRALDCNHTGEGGVSPKQEGVQQGFFMTPAAQATPARGRTAETQQVFRARGTETTGVTQM